MRTVFFYFNNLKVSREGGDGPLKSEILDDIIFPADEVVTMTFDNVDLNFATDESFTDSAISSKDHYKIENNEKVFAVDLL